MFDWATYLDLADALVTRVGGEAAERSAISRAYYACYGVAWTYAHARQAPLTRTGRDHTTVWDWFLATPAAAPVSWRVAQNGRRLKQWRIAADYDASYRGIPSVAQNALATARQLLADLEALP